ncbi:MAG: hypothetical protein BroJett011_18310 [Chloroflexota bacterium]|nr:MAG: hypothetical protein BroJett011_18310 [Chloroflexota bacterium]
MKSQVLDAPSASQLINQLIEEMYLGRSVLLITPETQSLADIRSAISLGVNRRNLWLEEISLGELPLKYDGAIAQLSDFLRLDPVPQTLEALLLHERCPEVILLNDIEKLSTVDSQTWFRLLENWAQQSKRIRDTQVHPVARRVCLCSPATVLTGNLPKSDVALSVRWWWSIPSSLEMQLLCRLQAPEYTLETIWREHLLPSLTGNDVELLEYLWDKVTQPLDVLVDSLQEFALAKGWKRHSERWTKLLKKQAPPKMNGFGYFSPPEAWRCFWDFGALIYTPEHGLEIHTAALVLLGQRKEVEQKMWRGQAGLLLPLLDNVRLNLCDYLTRRYGKGWPLKWAKPKDDQELERVKKNPLATQWGHLLQAVINSPYRDKLRKERPLVITGRNIRNELAHFRPISFLEFSAFWENWLEFEDDNLGTS